MTQRLDFLLGNEDFTTDRALLAVRQTSFRARCCLAGDDFFLVRQLRHFLLRNDDFAAVLALLAFRQAGFGAGRRLRGQDFHVLMLALALHGDGRAGEARRQVVAGSIQRFNVAHGDGVRSVRGIRLDAEREGHGRSTGIAHVHAHDHDAAVGVCTVVTRAAANLRRNAFQYR